MTDQQQPPLWEVMRDVYISAFAQHGCGVRYGIRYGIRYGYAAELRAIANEVVPEEPAEFPPRTHTQWIAWAELQAIRKRLLDAADEAEADRAEAGE